MKPVFALWATPGTLRLQLHRGCATRSCRRSVVHQVGLEPTKLSQRLKRPLPLPLGALVCIGLPSRSSRSERRLVDSGGYDPLEHGLKDRSLSIRVNSRNPRTWLSRLVSIQLSALIGRVP